MPSELITTPCGVNPTGIGDLTTVLVAVSITDTVAESDFAAYTAPTSATAACWGVTDPACPVSG